VLIAALPGCCPGSNAAELLEPIFGRIIGSGTNLIIFFVYRLLFCIAMISSQSSPVVGASAKKKCGFCKSCTKSPDKMPCLSFQYNEKVCVSKTFNSLNKQKTALISVPLHVGCANEGPMRGVCGLYCCTQTPQL
jgi:hypothetical protein